MTISTSTINILKRHFLKYSILLLCIFEICHSWSISQLFQRKCQPQKLNSSISVNLEYVSVVDVENLFKIKYKHKINQKGILGNNNCGQEKVAIIVPYKNREKQLGVFLRHMHPFLQKQDIKYRIFIVHQTDNSPFNRALLLNVGFLESLKIDNYECFVFSDIDLLPENEFNRYDCSLSPEHLAQNIKSYNYRNIYDQLFGGVSAMSRKHFEKVNGYANVYWGWGAEDDDLYIRLISNGLQLHRKHTSITRYTDNVKNHSRYSQRNPLRFKIINKLRKLKEKSGLNNAAYKIVSIEENMLFTAINVDLVPAFKDYLSNWEPLFKALLIYD